MSRLEEIKEHFRWTLNNSLVPRLHDSEIEWLIKQAERVESIIKHRNDILKANEYLNEQNQRYKQALEEIDNFMGHLQHYGFESSDHLWQTRKMIEKALEGEE